jgi:Cu-processing system permease protein
MQVLPDFAIALRLALRARFFSIAFWLLVVLTVAVVLASLFSGRQPATVGLDVGFSVIRLALPVVIVLLLQELLTREFDRKFFLASMTYPRPRHSFLLGRFLAVCALTLALLIVLAAALVPLVTAIAGTYEQATPVALDHRYWIVIAFIAVDVVVIAAMGTLLAIVAATPSFVLIGTLGFMLVARSFAPIVALLTRDSTLVENAERYRSSLDLLGYFLPDLAALDVRMIALYGQMSFLPPDWPLRLTTAITYGTGLVLLAVWALHRKRLA